MARNNRTHIQNMGGDARTPDHLKPKYLSKQEFGRRLYTLMVERGWNQSELARQAGLPRDAISNYILGKSFPTEVNLQKLAATFKIDADTLLPNRLGNAIARDTPDIELRRSPSDPKRTWLTINRATSYSVALKILALLEDDDISANGK